MTVSMLPWADELPPDSYGDYTTPVALLPPAAVDVTTASFNWQEATAEDTNHAATAAMFFPAADYTNTRLQYP